MLAGGPEGPIVTGTDGILRRQEASSTTIPSSSLVSIAPGDFESHQHLIEHDVVERERRVARAVAAHHDLDRGPVASDATDDVTQDLLDFLARWPLAGAQQ